MKLVQRENIEDSVDFTLDIVTGVFGLSPAVKNAISDGGMRYTMSASADNKEMELVEYPAGTNPLTTGTTVSSLVMKRYMATIDDMDIAGGVLNFVDNADPDNPVTISFDTTSPIFSILSANSKSIKATGNGKNTALKMEVILDNDSTAGGNNILSINAAGLSVDTNELLAYINSNLTLSASVSINTLTVGLGTQSATTTIVKDVTATHTPANNKLEISVNGVTSDVDTVILNDVFGNPIGSIIKHQ